MVNQHVSLKEAKDSRKIKPSGNDNDMSWISKLRNKIMEKVFSEDLK